MRQKSTYHSAQELEKGGQARTRIYGIPVMRRQYLDVKGKGSNKRIGRKNRICDFVVATS